MCSIINRLGILSKSLKDLKIPIEDTLTWHRYEDDSHEL